MAWLTYPYHCCAFQFPATHHPEEFAKHEVSSAEQLTHFNRIFEEGNGCIQCSEKLVALNSFVYKLQYKYMVNSVYIFSFINGY